MTRKELRDALSLGNREHFRTAYLVPALEAGVIETRPDKPNGQNRYRLTAAGRGVRRPHGAK